MSEAPPSPGPDAPPPAAVVKPRGRFSLIWLIPIAAAAVALWLGVQTFMSRGDLVTISFSTANGLTAGQTTVKHKAVSLGTVEGIRLSKDMSRVVVTVRMLREADRVLTDHARFWVVRPRFNLGNISGLETLVSGAYIEMDPGPPGGNRELHFTGLEEPPAVRSDEPGRTFVLKAANVGSLGPGAPVFYREVQVGEVLNYDLGSGEGPATVNIFIRSPYDGFVRPETHFWNASGVSVSFGAEGVHVQLESLQALVAGGVAFETPREAMAAPAPPALASFRLYPDKSAADSAGFRDRVPYVTYFQSSVRGLARRSPVEVYGIQVGNVTDVRLLFDPVNGTARVRVAMEIQPERVFGSHDPNPELTPLEVTRTLVGRGMRAQLATSNFLTGQEVVALQFVPDAAPADVSMEGDAIVVPSQAGGLDSITGAVTDIANKLGRLPIEQIGNNLNALIVSLNERVGGPEVKQAITGLSETMADLRDLVRKTNAGLTPALARLPEIAAGLQSAVSHADKVLGSVNAGYGQNSEFQRNLARLMDQVNDTARSIRLLADYLDRHPEALIRGRAGEAAQ